LLDPGSLGGVEEGFPSDRLRAWYRQNARDLPWRRTQDPWAILVAEVVLQQTRVEQAIPYFERILARFPTPETLAAAPLEELLRLWQGLGYYRRAEHLWRAAGAIAREGFPRTYAGLLRLPGLGPYTAGAVASIAFGEPVPAVDGNVRRVLARYHARERPGAAWLRDRAAALVDPRDPGTWNQALIELGATLCTPSRPACRACPLRRGCRGRDDPTRYPAPRRRRTREWRLAALVLLGRRGVVLEARPRGPWAGLFGPPMDEDEGRLLARFGLTPGTVRFLGEVRHPLSHRRVRVRVFLAGTERDGEDPAARPLSALARRVLALAQEALGEA